MAKAMPPATSRMLKNNFCLDIYEPPFIDEILELPAWAQRDPAAPWSGRVGRAGLPDSTALPR